MKMILGSSSKWRQRILREMGYEFEVMEPDIDEKAIRHPDTEQMVLAIARAKAKALLGRIEEPAILITSDQVTICAGWIREKPEDEDEARRFLNSYCEHPAVTVTAVVVTNTGTGETAEGVDIATLHFKSIPDEVIDALIEDGEVMQCCGAFVAEHELLKPYELRLEGELESIQGLPAGLTRNLIGRVQ